MLAFLTAFKSYFTASLLSTFTGGLFEGIAAENSTDPYLVFNVIASPSSSRYGGVSFSEPEIQFTSWAVGDSASLTNLQTLVTALDENVFSGAAFFVRRISEPIPAPGSPSLNKSGDYEYGWIVRYTYATT